MITWSVFPAFAAIAIILWTIGVVSALRAKTEKSPLCIWSTALGLMVYMTFIAGLWISLERPPLRTQGETRLWYSLFMIVSGWIIYIRWHYKWLPLFFTIVSAVFIIINILRPEIHDKSLMPALQSGWFVPHVTVYIFSYSLFGCAFLMAVAGMWRKTGEYLRSTDRMISIGMAFLTFGMLSGCIWAKQAWGNYWSWDPKETWAAATWAVYLVYVHYRLTHKNQSFHRTPYILLVVGFLLLQMCWYGINFLPSASSSLHSY